jgi:hypothetical protein
MSAFEADRFNHSRTSPRQKTATSHQLSAVGKKRIPHSASFPTTGDERLTTALKERLQQFGATAGQHSALHLDFVVQLRMIQHLHYRNYRAGFRIVRAIYETLDSGMHHCTGAHGAGFNCNKQFRLSQTVIPDVRGRLAERNDFGVGRGIGVGNIAIPPAPDDLVVEDDYRAHRDFADLECSLGAAEGFFHPEFVGNNRWSLVVRGWPHFPVPEYAAWI